MTRELGKSVTSIWQGNSIPIPFVQRLHRLSIAPYSSSSLSNTILSMKRLERVKVPSTLLQNFVTVPPATLSSLVVILKHAMIGLEFFDGVEMRVRGFNVLIN
jgi:hypothetical protein